MFNAGFRQAEARRVIRPERRKPLGRMLVEDGHLNARDLVWALQQQKTSDALLGEILIAEGLVAEIHVLDALARQHQVARVSLELDRPDMSMARELSPELCQHHTAVPWRRIGQTVFIAMARPDQLAELVQNAGAERMHFVPVIATQAEVLTEIGRLHGAQLAHNATTQLAESCSARRWGKTSNLRAVCAFGILCLLLACWTLWPLWTPLLLLGWSVLTLASTLGLKVVAFMAEMMGDALSAPPRARPASAPERWPRVSVMVPLYKEREIASALIARLERLNYPKHLLDVVLVLEAKDRITCETIANTCLPPWMRVIEVPDDGSVTTKPRALNYALNFCRGEIVGVWDAEDAPAADQIESVVRHFHTAADDVVCVQGMLDYYNARSNWIARCFTIEYATWWRIILPGLARLGFVIPLGGTTLFFRRTALERLGAWDAHNVTEDADLGVRLARAGYRTEILETVTLEEANCRILPWIRQRSRWLKGFMVTYCVHMRNPIHLLRDLGLRRFVGFQIMFLATFSQFATMPLLWLFWMPWVGFPADISAAFGMDLFILLAVFFLTAEFMNILIGMVAVSRPHHRHLMVWVLTMPIYFTMGAFAAYKALFEMIVTPFYWDKTSHGAFKADADKAL